MKRINNIVVSNTEPSVNSLWINQNTIRWFGKSGWEGLDFTDNTQLWNALAEETANREAEDNNIRKNALSNVLVTLGGTSTSNGYNIGYDVEKTFISGGSRAITANLEISNATSSANGMMSSTDKAKLDSIDATTLVNTEDGLIPSRFLPSYVDDVLEYSSLSTFPQTGEAGKIYVATDTNLTYRWSGTQYTEISPSIALGETASTAYPGNLGKQNADNIAALQNIVNNLDDTYLPLTGGTLTGNFGVQKLLRDESSGDILISSYLAFNPGPTDTFLIYNKSFNEPEYEAAKFLISRNAYQNNSQNYGVAISYADPYIILNKYAAADGGDLVISKDGITIHNKSTTDLLNAAGGTTSINDIVGNVDLSGYLPLTGGTLNGNLTLDGPVLKASTISIELDGQNVGYLQAYTPSTGNIAGRLSLGDSSDNISIEKNGITISDKTSNDLLNAAGGTTSISDITSNLATKDEVTEAVDNIDLASYATKEELDGYVKLDLGLSMYEEGYQEMIFGDRGYIRFAGRNGSYATSQSSIFIYGKDNGSSSTLDGIYLASGGVSNSLANSYIRIGEFTGISSDEIPQVDSSETYLTIYNDGIAISNKTTSDLLNAGGSTTSISDITTQVMSSIVDGAPETLDTLNELAAALGDDPNFATTITTQLGNKVDNSKWETIANTNIVTGINDFVYTENNVQLIHTYITRNNNGSFNSEDSTGKNINAATSTTAGVMSANDKTKLDSIEAATIDDIQALFD